MTIQLVTQSTCTWVLFLDKLKISHVKDNLFGNNLSRPKPTYDFIDLKWNTVVLSLKDLDLPMTNTLQVPR